MINKTKKPEDNSQRASTPVTTSKGDDRNEQTNYKPFDTQTPSVRDSSKTNLGTEGDTSKSDDFCLKPIKELTPQEKYQRYKATHEKLRKSNYKRFDKSYWAEKTREYAHANPDKISEKARRVYAQDKTKALVRNKTANSNERTGVCSDCYNVGKTEFHHISYEPNVFVELCKKCHLKRHGRILHV
jgi:hypothetical protein